MPDIMSKRVIVDKELPIVSIITSVFNSGPELEFTIKSVISQTYSQIEYIVIDGGSRDETLEIIKKYGHSIDYWTSEKDEGIYDAWNKGLNVSHGQWVAFLGAGDILDSDAIANLVTHCKDIGGLEFISGKVSLFKGEEYIRTVGKPWNFAEFKKYMCVAHPASMIRRSYFDKYGNFNKSYKIAGDYELLLRAGQYLKSTFVDSVLVKMQVGGASNSISVFKENYRAQIENKALRPLFAYKNSIYAIIKFRIRNFVYGY